MLIEEHLTESIIGTAIEVSSRAWARSLGVSLRGGLLPRIASPRPDFSAQIELPVAYKGLELDCGYRLDIVVQDSVVV
jgi:hypothetical protein